MCIVNKMWIWLNSADVTNIIIKMEKINIISFNINKIKFDIINFKIFY